MATPIEIEVVGQPGSRRRFARDIEWYLPRQVGPLEVRITVPWMGPAWVHHPVLPRMLNRLWARVDQDWRSGDPSPLTAPFHFDASPGLQPFGMPRFLALRNEKGGFAFGWEGGTLVHSSVEWRQCETGIELNLRFERPADGSPWEPPCIRWVSAEPRELLTPRVFALAMGELDSRFHRAPDQTVTWATWNDGVFRDIDAERILDTSRFLAQTFENVGWIQVDDGWAPEPACVPSDDGSLGMSDLSAFYRPERLVGDPRFPEGMRGLAGRIRDLGFRPMIWLTPAADARSELVLDHPEWFQESCRLHFMPHLRFLDLSVPEARAFLEHAFDLAFDTWTFEGTKLDFWSMGFEQTDATCRAAGRTPMEWMGWMLDAIRQRIPEDGRVVHCIDLPFGGPVRARWCDHFRFYADSEGSCAVPSMVREQAAWTALMTARYGVQRWWIPNADGLGTFPHIGMGPADHRRWVALVTASGTLTELAGWLDRAEPAAVERVRTATRWAQLGGSVVNPGFDPLATELLPPNVWVCEGQRGTVVGVTNWSDEPLTVEVPPGVGLLTNAFDGQPVETQITVPAGDGALLVPR